MSDPNRRQFGEPGMVLNYRSALLGGVVAVALAISGNSEDAVAEQGAVSFATTVNPACVNPSVRSLEAVDELLDRPQSQKAVADYEKHTDHYEKQIKAFAKMSTRTEKQQKAFFRKANRILDPYEVSLELGDRSVSEFSVANEIKTTSGKIGVVAAVRGITRLPEDFVKFSGIHTVVLKVGNENDQPAYVDVQDTEKRSKVYFDLFTASSTMMGHELTHPIDAHDCGSIDNENTGLDPVLEAINQPGTVYGHRKDRRYKAQVFEGATEAKLATIESKLTVASGKRSKQLRAKKAALLKDVAFVSNYSLTNTAEDKAEIGSYLIKPTDFDVVTDSDAPRLREKARLLLARIYERKPALAKQIISVGDRAAG